MVTTEQEFTMFLKKKKKGKTINVTRKSLTHSYLIHQYEFS